MKNIKLLAMDVDGTMTDGIIHISDGGELFKSFNCKDGYALKKLLPDAGIIPVIITGRESKIVERRAGELNINEVYQNVEDKAETLIYVSEKYGLRNDEIAYIGDDLSDLSAMLFCGVSACPADAVSQIKTVADYVCTKKGGEGTIHEFIEWLIQNKVD